MELEKLFFRLYAHSILVAGAKKYMIYDILLNRYKYIPQLLYSVLEDLETLSIEETKRKYNNEIDEGMDTYLNFLEKNNWGFRTKNIELFPKLNLEYETPLLISHALIDIYSISEQKELLQKSIEELTQIGCEQVLLIIEKIDTLEDIRVIGNAIKNTSFASVEIKCIYNQIMDKTWMNDLKIVLETNRRIRKIKVYNSPYDKVITSPKIAPAKIFIRRKEFDNCKISKPCFFINQSFFIEAKNRNSCLNGKVCIDRFGNIKNCLNMNANYGNIDQQSIRDVILNTDFRSVWMITKDNIKVCKDCEYRYQCQDCRAFTEDSDDLYSKPSFCKYNPYHE